MIPASFIGGYLPGYQEGQDCEIGIDEIFQETRRGFLVRLRIIALKKCHKGQVKWKVAADQIDSARGRRNRPCRRLG
jgi:hypothetical protein